MKENDPLIHTDYCEGFFPYSFRSEVNSNSLVRIALPLEEIQKRYFPFPKRK